MKWRGYVLFRELSLMLSFANSCSILSEPQYTGDDRRGKCNLQEGFWPISKIRGIFLNFLEKYCLFTWNKFILKGACLEVSWSCWRGYHFMCLYHAFLCSTFLFFQDRTVARKQITKMQMFAKGLITSIGIWLLNSTLCAPLKKNG